MGVLVRPMASFIMRRSDGEVSWTWAMYSSAEWTTKVAFEAGYNRASRSNDTEDISGLVRFGIVAR